MKRFFLTLAFMSFASFTIFAQTENRIIKIEKNSIARADDKTFLEITNLKVGNNNIFLNEAFTADENWLKNIKIKVKNVSEKTLTCVAIVFGLLEGIYEELEPQMSWGDKLALYYGNCSEKNKKKFKLKNGEEVELTYDNIDALSREYFEKIGVGKFHKAKLIYGMLKIKNGDSDDNLNWRVPNNVRRFDEDKN